VKKTAKNLMGLHFCHALYTQLIKPLGSFSMWVHCISPNTLTIGTNYHATSRLRHPCEFSGSHLKTRLFSRYFLFRLSVVPVKWLVSFADTLIAFVTLLLIYLIVIADKSGWNSWLRSSRERWARIFLFGCCRFNNNNNNNNNNGRAASFYAGTW